MYGKAIMSFHCIDLARDGIERPALQVSGSNSTALVTPSATLALSFQNPVQIPITLMKLQILKRTPPHTLPLATVCLGGGTAGFDRHFIFCNGICKNIWAKKAGLHIACS